MVEEWHKLVGQGPEFEGTIHRASGEIGHWLLPTMVVGEEPAQICDEFGMCVQIGLKEPPILEKEHIR